MLHWTNQLIHKSPHFCELKSYGRFCETKQKLNILQYIKQTQGIRSDTNEKCKNLNKNCKVVGLNGGGSVINKASLSSSSRYCCVKPCVAGAVLQTPLQLID